jgi:SAM-dependent methyltransferase
VAALFSGDGPGVQTADGCSVDLYRLLKYHGELEEMRTFFPKGGEVLELGCGTGRMTNRLLEFGSRVTAVDNSVEMLAEVPKEAIRVAANIETLQLDKTFDVVVLASNFINHPTEAVRDALVKAARRHSAPGTRFLIERHDPQWLRTVQVGALGVIDGVALHVESIAREADTVSMTLRYEAPSAQWRQYFSTTSLSKAFIESILSSHGFGCFAWIGQQGCWLSSTLAPSL